MSYTVMLTRRFEKRMAKIPEPMRSRIWDAVEGLEHDPRPDGCKKMRGHDSTYRIRIGDYRVIYSVHDSTIEVTVEDVGPRGDIY